jgi:DNA repair protein RadD
MIELRPYQRESVDALWRYFEEHDGNPLLVLPTGAGKSVVQAAFVQSVLEQYPEQRFLCLTHVKELIEQNAAALEAILGPWTVGVYSAGLRRRELEKPVTVASVQSLVARLQDLPSADLVIIDECHLVPPDGEGRYRSVLASLRALNPALKVIGMSATPYRLKSGWLHRGEGRIFTHIAHEVAIAPLVEAGWLCPLRSKSGRSEADLTKVKVRGGEFVGAELEAAMVAGDLVPRSLDEVERYCTDRRKWLVFCAGIKHAVRVTEELEHRGHRVGLVTGEMPIPERDEVIGAFRRGEFRALVNVNVLTTGFDVKDVDAVVLMRATKSAGLYYQMVGRAMRPHPSKADALILDFGGNILRHGPVDAIEIRTRAGDGGPPPQKTCPECREVAPIAATVCPACGFEFPVRVKPPHESVATELPVLSVPTDIDVDAVYYGLHRKAGKPDSMRVEYLCGLITHREWVCFEHTGFPAQRAAQWWRRRAAASSPTPKTTTEALKRASELRDVKTIRIRREGEFWRVVSATFVAVEKTA